MMILIVTLFLQLVGPTGINFEHKSVYKAIRKKFHAEDPVIVPVHPSGSTLNSMKTGVLFAVSTKRTDTVGYVYIGRVQTCRAGGCSLNLSDESQTADFEYFDYFILFDTVGIIEHVKVYNYQASHGHEITVKGWLKQFQGYSGKDELRIGKNVDGISGATISVHGITYDIEEKTKLMHEYLKRKRSLISKSEN